jgi:hypothetical protein
VKRDVAAPGAPETPVRVEFEVSFSRSTRGKRRVQAATPALEATQVVARHAVESPPAPMQSVMRQVDPAPEAHLPVRAERVHKVALLLTLGHYFERLVRDGGVKDYAEIARRTGLTRARVTQIVNLTLLSSGIQNQVLSLTDERGQTTLTEGRLRRLARAVAWKESE